MKNKKRRKKYIKSGFTLIELLVVTSIIALISSILLVALNNARVLARDVVRKADLNQLATALELFYDTYGLYPCGDSDWFGRMTDSSLSLPFIDGVGGIPVATCSQPPYTGLYHDVLIGENWHKDPINIIGRNFYSYEVSNDRQEYLIYVNLEKDLAAMSKDGGICKNFYERGSALGKWADLKIVAANAYYPVSCN